MQWLSSDCSCEDKKMPSLTQHPYGISLFAYWLLKNTLSNLSETVSLIIKKEDLVFHPSAKSCVLS